MKKNTEKLRLASISLSLRGFFWRQARPVPLPLLGMSRAIHHSGERRRPLGMTARSGFLALILITTFVAVGAAVKCSSAPTASTSGG